MENSSVASASSEAGSSRSQEIEELERFIDSYVLEYQVQGLLTDKTEGDGESEKTQSHISQWTADCSEQLDGSCSPSRGKGLSSHEHNQNGNKETSLDMLGTDIWAANTFDSFSGVTWDSQPEKLDFTQFHRKLRNTSKHPLPHIDREGLGKGKYEDGDSINLNDIEKVLPVWQQSTVRGGVRENIHLSVQKDKSPSMGLSHIGVMFVAYPEEEAFWVQTTRFARFSESYLQAALEIRVPLMA
nr:CBP80/20-dependent translation initiation factor-like isoform X4 [Columba livia]